MGNIKKYGKQYIISRSSDGDNVEEIADIIGRDIIKTLTENNVLLIDYVTLPTEYQCSWSLIGIPHERVMENESSYLS